MKYEAFISYRHTPLDMEVAKKLHKALETYKIPKSVQKKTGKKRINRVFRDQEELPIGSDLSENITAALEDAEFLVVICSPDTPKSEWVIKEIETFIKLHDRNHVLAILIDGEPEDSFPHPLIQDEDGNNVEPLAADIRGADKKERNRKFKTELLRLVAPIIGCTYDDLKQRHKERIRKRNLTIAFAAISIVALFSSVFGIYSANTAARMKQLADEKSQLADEKTLLADEKAQLASDLLTELQEKQISQSKFLAKESGELLDYGNREDAVLVAIEGLPYEGNERPYVTDSEYALSEAMQIYKGDMFQIDRCLKHDLDVVDFFISDDNSKLITVDSTLDVYVWDTEDMSLKVKISEPPHYHYAWSQVIKADADENYIYICYSDYLYIFDYYGIQRFYYEPTYEMVDIGVDIKNNHLIIIDGNLCRLFSLDTLIEDYSVELKDFDGTQSFIDPAENRLVLSPTNDFICVFDHSIIYVIGDGDDAQLSIKPNLESILYLYITNNGNIAVLSGEKEKRNIALYTRDGVELWNKEYTGSVFPEYYKLTGADFEYYDENHSCLIVAEDNFCYAYGESTGGCMDVANTDSCIRGILVVPDSRIIYIAEQNGNIIHYYLGGVPFDDPYRDLQLECGVSQMGYVTCNNNFNMILKGINSSTIYTACFTPSYYTNVIVSSENRFYPSEISAYTEDYCIVKSETEYKYFDRDFNLLYSHKLVGNIVSEHIVDNVHVIYYGNGFVYYVDPINKTEESVQLKDIPGYFESYYKSLDNGNFLHIFDYESNSLYIFDISQKKMISTIQCDDTWVDALVSHDGKYVYIINLIFSTDNTKTTEVIKYNIETKQKQSWRINDFYINKMLLSDDDNYLSLAGMDRIVIIDTESNGLYADFSVTSDYNIFMDYVDDSETFIFQTVDNSVTFFDLNTKQYINMLEAKGEINIVIDDHTHERLILVVEEGLSEYTLYILSTENYGLLAEIPEGIGYFASDESIVRYHNHADLEKIKYYNYEELIEEARNQFPNAELTDEQKTQYNIY